MSAEQPNRPKLDTETKLRLLISLINDEGSHKLESSMDKLVGRLMENYESHRNVIKKYLIESILYIPLKTSIYANLLKRIYLKKERSESIRNFIKEIIDEVCEFMNNGIRTKLEEKNFDPFILFRFIRFIFELYYSEIITLSTLENFTEKLLTYSNKNYRNILIQYTLLNLIFTNVNSNNVYTRSLISKIDAHLKTSSIDAKFFNKENHKYFSTILNFLKSEENSQIDTDLFLSLQSSESLIDQEKIELDYTIEIPENYLNTCSLYFSNYDSHFETESLNSSFNFIDRIILRIYIEESINAFHDKLSLAIQYLQNLPLFFGLKNENQITDDVNSIIIQNLLNMILKPLKNLSNSSVITYFSSLIYNFTKNSQNLNKSLNKEIEYAFSKINEFNISSIENFANFLVFYIPSSTTENSVLIFQKFKINSNSGSYKKILFVKMLLEKLCLNLTKQKVESMVKDSNCDLQSFLPENLEKPKWKFVPNEPFYFDIQNIIDNIQNKKEYSQWTEKFDATGSDFVYLLCSCLFYARSKTLSHLRETLNFYSDALKTLINSQDRIFMLLNALFDVWGNSPIYIKFIIENLLNKSIFTNYELMTYLFHEKISKNSDYYLDYEIVEMSLPQSERLINRLRNNLRKEQENLISSEESRAEIVKNIEELEFNIEKLNKTSENLSLDSLVNYFNVYFYNKDSNQKEILFERIVNLCRNYKFELIKHKEVLNQKFAKLEIESKELNEILVNLNIL